MQRSRNQAQDKKSLTPSPAASTSNDSSSKNTIAGGNASSLEKAYGTTSTKPKQGMGAKQPLKKSSIVAASKASYAEKYGSLSTTMGKGRPPQKYQKPAGPGVGLVVKPSVTQEQKRTTNTSNTKLGSMKGTVSQMKSSSTHPQQKSDPLDPSEASGEKQTEKYTEEYDEDFEEDYQSDFEQIASDEDSMREEENSADHIQIVNVKDPDEVIGLAQQSSNFLVSESSDSEEDPAPIVMSKPGFFRTTSVSSLKIDTKNSTDVEHGTESMQIRDPAGDMQNIASHQIAEKKITTLSDETNNHDNLPRRSLAQRRTFDFEGAHEKLEKDNKLVRSKQLRSMIKLHNINSVTLFHIDTSPEQYAFAVSGTLSHHKGVQAEKTVQNFSAQTDLVEMTHKWTQRPPAWSTGQVDQSDIRILREESLGVGTEMTEKKLGAIDNNRERKVGHQMQWEYDVGLSWNRISKFISRASRKMLYVLESQKRLAGHAGASSEAKFTRGLPVFNNLDMGCLTCYGDFIACANFYPPEKSQRKSDAKSVITIWSMKEPSCPKFFLRMWGKVTAIVLFVYGHIAVAGGKDGGLAIWDLDENPDYHKAYLDQTIRTATIDTALLEQGHKDAIVGLKVISQSEDHSLIMSMDRSGVFKSWSITRSSEIIPNPHYPQHTAYWSRLNLCHKNTINLNDSLREQVLLVSTFIVPTTDDAQTRITDFVCGTVNGFVARSSLIKFKKDESIIRAYYKKSSTEVNECLENGNATEEECKDAQKDPIITKQLVIQKYFQPDYKTSITAMDINSSLNLCLAGSTDGKCYLYSLPYRKLLLIIHCEAEPLNILRVHFSRKRQSVFYVALKHAVQIYDLLKSESTPWKVIRIPNIQDMEIYFSVLNEFTIVLASNELKASMSCGDFQSLNEQEHKKFTSRLEALLL